MNEYEILSDEMLMAMHRIASENFERSSKLQQLDQTRLEKILALMMERGLLID